LLDDFPIQESKYISITSMDLTNMLLLQLVRGREGGKRGEGLSVQVAFVQETGNGRISCEF